MSFGMVLFFFGFFLILSNLNGVLHYGEKQVENQVKCYDKNSNEIVNTTCLEKKDVHENELNLFFIGLLLILIGTEVFQVNYEYWKDEHF